MGSLRTWLLGWGPSLVMMALIFGGSSTPGNNLPSFSSWDTILRKGGHVFGYALLGLSYMHGLAGSRKIKRRTLALAVIMAAAYAISDEFHQSFTPGRTASVTDVVIDTFGAVIGVGVWSWVKSARDGTEGKAKSHLTE